MFSPHGKLVQVGLADQHGAPLPHPVHHGGVVRGAVVPQHAGRAARAHAPRAEVVLVGHGDAFQRTGGVCGV